MTLVEKKVLTEKKNYLNMAIQLKKSSSKFSSKKNNYIKHSKRGKFANKYFYKFFKRKKGRFYINHLNKKSLFLRIKHLYFLNKYGFYFTRKIVQTVRLKKYLYKYKRYKKKRL